jgi:hypothetical protein
MMGVPLVQIGNLKMSGFVGLRIDRIAVRTGWRPAEAGRAEET